jgi:hypothetical protein
VRCGHRWNSPSRSTKSYTNRRELEPKHKSPWKCLLSTKLLKLLKVQFSWLFHHDSGIPILGLTQVSWLREEAGLATSGFHAVWELFLFLEFEVAESSFIPRAIDYNLSTWRPGPALALGFLSRACLLLSWNHETLLATLPQSSLLYLRTYGVCTGFFQNVSRGGQTQQKDYKGNIFSNQNYFWKFLLFFLMVGI